MGTLGQLRSIGHALRAWPTLLGVAINSADKIWSETGELADGTVRSQLDMLATQLLTFGTLRWSRAVTAQRTFERRGIEVDGLVTSYLEAGSGDAVVLLHGGEFGAGPKWVGSVVIDALAEHYRVLAPDMLGFGESAKVIDFNDGRGMRIRHIARLCAELGVTGAHFVGNSMGAINLLVDATSEAPRLPARSLTAICGGGDPAQ